MSNFFSSEIIHNELKKINELQQNIYSCVYEFQLMSQEDKLEHIEKMSSLLELQRIMYTRLSLSDDPKAIEMKENLKKTLLYVGISPNTDMNSVFSSIGETIEALRNHFSSRA